MRVLDARPAYWINRPGPDSQWHNPNWMSKLPDSTHLSELSIPGTHDTMSYETQKIGVPWVWCQCLDLETQLKMGIRFLDIRCRDFGEGLPLHHDVYYLNRNFNDGLEIVSNYLRNHIWEFVVVNVQEEHSNTGESFTNKVHDVLDRYGGIVYEGGKNPTLSDIRGKIVVLAHFNTTRPYLKWDEFEVENHWDNVSTNDKFDFIKKNFEHARDWKNYFKFLTFSSRTKKIWGGSLGYKYPRTTAQETNPKVLEYLKQNKGRVGIVAMNYPGPELIRNIIEHNHHA